MYPTGASVASVTAAQADATSALANAATAQTTANTGVINAATAQSTANTASTNASSAVTTANAASAAALAAAPSGTMAPWTTASAPAGWLLCNGAAVSRTTYAALFAIISTTYGAGDASTTFNVPDMRGKFPLGVAASGTGSSLAGTGGTIDHLHTVDPPNTTSTTPSATLTGISVLGAGVAGSGTATVDTNIAQFNSGTQNPPFLALNYIIKT